jgi:hypothetical protein
MSKSIHEQRASFFKLLSIGSRIIKSVECIAQTEERSIYSVGCEKGSIQLITITDCTGFIITSEGKTIGFGADIYDAEEVLLRVFKNV